VQRVGERPFVSIVIPCRDEKRLIRSSLESIIANDYPKERLEVLVVDGMSTDGTRAILRTYEERYPFVRILDNPKKIIPAAMNIGIRNARGEVILKVDAHSVYANDYVSKCVEYQYEYDADNVGGVLVTRPREDTAVARAIALVLAHPFGSGNSHFRLGSREPRWVDTAAFGCYRRDVFSRIGTYNESVVRSSDMDLNARLRRAGGRVLLVPAIVADYYPSSRLRDFFVRNVVDGFWALYPLRFGSRGVRVRHVVPLACLLLGLGLSIAAVFEPLARYLLLVVLGGYSALAVGVAVQAVVRERRSSFIVLLPIVFAVRHVAYAVGSLWGAVRVVLSRRRPRDGAGSPRCETAV
jgi:glycosyltransferase involved in cell wall biosynthesis